VAIDAEQWVPGVVIGAGGEGTFVTIKLDTPLDGGERRGLMRRESRGEDIVSFDDPARVRPLKVDPDLDGVSEENIELARAGKTLQAIKRYRALNGATWGMRIGPASEERVRDRRLPGGPIG
jgi:hypothetical protein